jgi:hypothetical protein
MKAFTIRIFRRWYHALLGFALFVGCATAHAAVSCNMSARSLGELFDAGGTSSVQGDMRISCTRTSTGDPSTIFYSIKADFGLHSSGGFTRNVRDPVSNTNLLWVLRTGACGNTTDWGTAASPGLLTGNVSFVGSALFLNTTITNAYCMRVRGNTGGANSNPAAPAAGAYVDTVTLAPEFSSTGITGPFTIIAPTTQVSFNVGVGAMCVVRKQGDDLFFNYTAFSAAQTDVSNFQALCSSTLPYSITVSPTSGTIAGINYTVTRIGTLGRTGDGTPQPANIRVNIAGNQAGICSMSTCSGTAVHTVTLTY